MKSLFNTIEGVAELVASGENVRIRVKGRSMSPTFKNNKDFITISPIGDHELCVGDVVLFDRGDSLCVHRIVGINGDKLVIKGDGNSISALEYATSADVKGIILSGTFHNGTPFTVYDEQWKKNTEFVMKNAGMLSAWYRFTGIVRRYPLSILVSVVLLYLSFFNPTDLQITLANDGDKLIHGIMYFSCTLVFWFEWIYRHRQTRRDMLVGMLPCVLFPIVMGGLIEIAQEYLTDCRSGELKDFMANICGIVAAMILSCLVTRPLVKLFRKRRAKTAKVN